MEQIITTIITILCSVLTALGGFVIAYLRKRTKDLEKELKNKDTQIQIFNNGFRDKVYKELKQINGKECIKCKGGKN